MGSKTLFYKCQLSVLPCLLDGLMEENVSLKATSKYHRAQVYGPVYVGPWIICSWRNQLSTNFALYQDSSLVVPGRIRLHAKNLNRWTTKCFPIADFIKLQVEFLCFFLQIKTHSYNKMHFLSLKVISSRSLMDIYMDYMLQIQWGMPCIFPVFS